MAMFKESMSGVVVMLSRSIMTILRQVEIFQQVQYDACVQLEILCNEGETMSTLAKLSISTYYMQNDVLS